MARTFSKKWGIEIGSSGGRGYEKLFDDEKNVQQAIEMLNAGYTYQQTGAALGCDRTSVHAFYKRKVEEGVEFIDYTENGKRKMLDPSELIWQEHWVMLRPIKHRAPSLKLNPDAPPVVDSLVYCGGEDKINHGKLSYKKYLEESKAREADLAEKRKERMAQARQQIKDLKKWRKKQGMGELDKLTKSWDWAQDM